MLLEKKETDPQRGGLLSAPSTPAVDNTFNSRVLVFHWCFGKGFNYLFTFSGDWNMQSGSHMIIPNERKQFDCIYNILKDNR